MPICGVPPAYWLTGRSFVAATYIKYDSLLKTSGALHLDFFEQPAKNDFFGKLLGE